jgi:formylglycine-generating enzyme required for sulfatase activity
MSQPLPENSDSQELLDSTPKNLIRGDKNRAIQGDKNQAVLGDGNKVINGNNNTQNNNCTINYYFNYPQEVGNDSVKPVESSQNTLDAEANKAIRAPRKLKPALQKYRFEYAEVTKPSGFFESLRKPNITYCRKEARYFIENLGGGVELEMVNIPSGAFFMGSPEETKPHSSELPRHLISINPFFIGKYPITQKQWKAVAYLPQINRPLIADCSKFKGDSYPVEQVCWDDAVEFCNRLSLYTGLYYRLPCEAEWEYAVRAGTTTLFHFGDIIIPDLVNYKDCGFNQTTPVDKFQYANIFGLYCMHGLVWEWCIDHWHDSYKKAPNDGKAWVNNRNSKLRVIRGGSWADTFENCRSASRNKAQIHEQGSYLGFRVVCE